MLAASLGSDLARELENWDCCDMTGRATKFSNLLGETWRNCSLCVSSSLSGCYIYVFSAFFTAISRNCYSDVYVYRLFFAAWFIDLSLWCMLCPFKLSSAGGVSLCLSVCCLTFPVDSFFYW